MLNITLGQYIPVPSPIHSMDPRVKILLLLFFCISIFLFYGPFPSLFFGFFILFLAKLSHVPFFAIWCSVKPLWWLIVFTMLFHFFGTQGDSLWSWGGISVTKEGVEKGVLLSLRLVYLVAFSALLTFTTSQLMLTEALEKLLSPFKKLGLPAHELSMMMTIALRFIPTLVEELDRIMKAQQSRGVNFSEGSLVKRFKNMVPILVPLFISAFRRADDLATAMEARSYRGHAGRSNWHELSLTGTDLWAIACSALIFLLLLCYQFMYVSGA